MGKKFIKHEDYFNLIDTELKAYLLGFFLADGCITNPSKGSKCFGMCLQEKDKSILELFKQELAPMHKISEYKKKATGNIQCSLKFTAKQFAINMEELYNITSSKTTEIDYEFPFEKVPKELIRHFIRGYFDGDGTVTKRDLEKNLVPQIGFVATSKKFLEQLIEYIPVKEYRLTTSEGKNMTYYQLWYSGGKKKDIQLQNYFYKDAKYYLKRKFNKFKENTELTLGLTN